MRIALRLLSVLTLVCIVAGFVLLSVANNTGADTSPYFLYSLLTIVLGFLCTIVTVILGIVATALNRQFGWLVVILAAGLLPLAGTAGLSFLISALTPQSPPSQYIPPECKVGPGTPVPTGCPPVPTSAPGPSQLTDFANVAQPWFAVGGPILVAVLVFVYSFRMRDPARVAV